MATASRLPLELRVAYFARHRQTDACLATSKRTADPFVLLGRLASGDAVTQQELARQASSDANTVRAMLVLLEKRGLGHAAGPPHRRPGPQRKAKGEPG